MGYHFQQLTVKPLKQFSLTDKLKAVSICFFIVVGLEAFTYFAHLRGICSQLNIPTSLLAPKSFWEMFSIPTLRLLTNLISERTTTQIAIMIFSFILWGFFKISILQPKQLLHRKAKRVIFSLPSLCTGALVLSFIPLTNSSMLTNTIILLIIIFIPYHLRRLFLPVFAIIVVLGSEGKVEFEAGVSFAKECTTPVMIFSKRTFNSKNLPIDGCWIASNSEVVVIKDRELGGAMVIPVSEIQQISYNGRGK